MTQVTGGHTVEVALVRWCLLWLHRYNIITFSPSPPFHVDTEGGSLPMCLSSSMVLLPPKLRRDRTLT